MPKRPATPLWSSFRLDPAALMSRHDQIAAFVLGAIGDGSLRPGTRLPSSRVLAVDLGVAHQTAVLAYETLCAEGYAVARAGAGVFVSQSLPVHVLPPATRRPRPRRSRHRCRARPARARPGTARRGAARRWRRFP